MSRRKGHAEEHENHERWLVSYADFITLLFAFFVVLYAISQVDLKKLSEAKKSFGTSFRGSSAVEANGDPQRKIDPESWRYAPIFPNVIEEESSGDGDRVLRELQRRLIEILSADGLDDGVRIAVEGRGLVVRMKPRALFTGSGSLLSADGAQLLDRLGTIMRTIRTPVLIRTISRPTTVAELPGNFELQTARVAAVGRYLLEARHLTQQPLFMSGNGEIGGSDGVPGEVELIALKKGEFLSGR